MSVAPLAASPLPQARQSGSKHDREMIRRQMVRYADLRRMSGAGLTIHVAKSLIYRFQTGFLGVSSKVVPALLLRF